MRRYIRYSGDFETDKQSEKETVWKKSEAESVLEQTFLSVWLLYSNLHHSDAEFSILIGQKVSI